MDDHVSRLFAKLGIDRKEDLPADAIAKALAAGRSIDISHPFEMTIKRSLVNGSQRIEFTGYPHQPPVWVQPAACSTEIIQYRTRLFVPTASADAVLANILGQQA